MTWNLKFLILIAFICGKEALEVSYEMQEKCKKGPPCDLLIPSWSKTWKLSISFQNAILALLYLDFQRSSTLLGLQCTHFSSPWPISLVIFHIKVLILMQIIPSKEQYLKLVWTIEKILLSYSNIYFTARDLLRNSIPYT